MGVVVRKAKVGVEGSLCSPPHQHVLLWVCFTCGCSSGTHLCQPLVLRQLMFCTLDQRVAVQHPDAGRQRELLAQAGPLDDPEVKDVAVVGHEQGRLAWLSVLVHPRKEAICRLPEHPHARQLSVHAQSLFAQGTKHQEREHLSRGSLSSFTLLPGMP